jgi:hypothetical protein
MVFNKINNSFTLLINLEMWQPLVHLFLKIVVLFMFRGVEKFLVYQRSLVYEHITKVSKKFWCISEIW